MCEISDFHKCGKIIFVRRIRNRASRGMILLLQFALWEQTVKYYFEDIKIA